MIADASFAVLALFFALDAVRRYRLSHDDVDGPIPDTVLEDLHLRAGRGRDAVAHFDDKVARSPNAELRIDATKGVTITAPPLKRGSQDETTHISWHEMEDAARAAVRWLARLEARSL